MQATNLGIVDQFLTQLEFQVLEESFKDDKDPSGSERNASAEETETVPCQSSPIHRHPSCIRQGYTVSLVGFFEMSPVCS
ncbi:hypothetical protein DEV91_12413 [Phyllobacterium brassicacearum]|nr:hypothetical protein DEV91_12413 [Phyllobacterium brassicacearum]